MLQTVIDYIQTNPLDVAGGVLGLLYLLLEIKENIIMWIVGCIMPAIYIFVLYGKGIYADCGMEVFYFLVGIYGFYTWLRGGKQTDTKKLVVKISRTPKRTAGVLVIVSVVLWGALVLFLKDFTDSRVPFIDGLTTALSIVAYWMLSRKYVEQWWVWFVVDLLSTCLYVYKGIYARSILYGVYTIMAVYGYYAWKRKMASLS